MVDQPKDYSKIGRSILLKQAAKGTPTGVPDIPIFQGYQSQNFPINQKQTSAEQNINDLMRLPPDWDYKTAQMGPRGEKLPEGALGWTPHATPYYGPGLEGWWKGTVSRLNSPISYASDTIIPQAEEGEELGWWEKALGTIENLGAQFYNAGGEEGGQPSPLTYATRGISEIVKSGLALAAVPSLGFERTQGAGEAIEEEFEGFDLPEPIEPIVEFMSRTSPAGWIYKVTNMLATGQKTENEALDMIKEGFNSGRVFYTTFTDPSVTDEYKRRYQAGEDPVLLGMELENPMAELVGQLVLDPLNLLGLGARKLKDARKIGSVADDYFRIAPDIENVLRGADEADEIAAVGKIQELTRAVAKSFDDLKNDYRISALTADGKRYVVSRKTNELAEWTLRTNSGNDPDRAMEILEGVIRLSSDDADDVALGISQIRGAAIEPSPYFSRAGQEMSVTLRNLVTDETGKINPQKFIDDLGEAASKGVKVGDEVLDGVEGVAYHVSNKMDDTIEKMFPTVAERLKAGEDLPFALRAIGRFNSAAQKSVYRPLNTFFAGIYMGLSPGYAMRNMFTNTLHVLVDQGPGALRYKPTTLLGRTANWLGGQLPDVAGFSAGTQGVETIKGISRKLPFSKLSERFEEWGAVQVVSKSVQDTMRRMLRPGRALPDVRPLVDAGMDQQSANLLLNLVVENYGDVGKAAAQFKQQVAGGNIDAFRTLTWLGEDSRAALYGFNMGDEVLEALKGATSREDAIARVNTIFDDVASDGARVADEVPVASEMAEGVDIIDDLSTAVAEGVDIPQNLIENATSSIEANSQAMYSVTRTARKLWNGASARALDDPEKLRELNVFRQKYPDLFDEVLVAKGEEIHAGNRATAVGWKNKFKTQGKDASLATLRQWWDEIGIPGEAPADLTLDRLWSDMWGEWYFPKVREHWQKVRDEQFGIFENVVAEMNEIFPFNREMTELLDEPRQLQDLALWWDEHLISDSMGFALTRAEQKKDFAQVARIYANWVGIPSQSDTGASLDQYVLNVINNNITEGRYATLADVPPEVSQKAFITHATKNVAAEAGDTAPVNLLEKALNDPLNFTDEEEELFLAALGEYDPALQKEWGQAYAARKMATPENLEDITKFPAEPIEVIKPFDYAQENMSRADLPDYVSDQIKREAERLRGELSGTGVELVPADEPKYTGHMVRRSTNPQWYLDIYGEGFKNKKGVLRALDKIVEGNDIGRANEKYLPKLKEIIINNLEGAGEAPADPRFYLELGMQEEASKAFRELMEEGLLQGRTDADLAEMVGGTENLNRVLGIEEGVGVEESLIRVSDNITAADDELARVTKKVMDRMQTVPKPEASPYAGNTPSMARVLEQSSDGLRDLQDEILRGINDNYGRVVPQGWNNDLEKAFNSWTNGATKGVAKARLIATDVANAARDFTMLSYPQKKYFDLALAYIYPYHFWYNRTYSNWLKRIATNPEVIAGYAKYKNTLAKIHAGAPDWWKYNINSNELLGLDSENPLFFNLESTLNPLNGLTGVDFNDSKKRVNWFTATLDDMNKFGPSTWTPFSIATAAMLYAQGEEEAASRWGGRLVPQTAALKNLTSVLNIGPPGGLELDPNVLFFSGGIDPYERRRVGRALYGLQEEGMVDGASAIDAAYFQEGEAWDMARERASNSRALGQLTSFLFGTGFKARSASDMQIDIFDAEYFNLWANEANYHPDEFKQMMDQMRKDYPFMDAVLLSRKAGYARDRGFVYNVLGRIPPGQRDDIAKEAGLDYDFISQFYEDKGHIEDWEETDKDRLMAWAVDVAAILDMPDRATKEEWKAVSGRYAKMTDMMQGLFGEDIEDEIQIFYTKRRIDDDDAYAYLDANPHVEQAMSWKDATMINDALMSQYYMSLKKVEGYYNGVMYDAIEHEFGKDIWDIQDGYFEAKLLGKKQAKQYLKDYPQLIDKWDTQDSYEEETAQRIIDVADLLRDDIHPFIRAGAEARSLAQQNIMEALQTPTETPYQLGWEDFRVEMSPHLQSLVEDTVLYGEDLSSAAQDQLEFVAKDFGLDSTTMMELISRSMIGQ